MAQFDIASLWDVFLKIIGLFGGGLAGLFVLGIFTRRTNGYGAVGGFVMSIIVQYLVQRSGDIHFFLYGVTGIVSCCAGGYLLSLIIPCKQQSLENLTLYTITPNAGA